MCAELTERGFQASANDTDDDDDGAAPTDNNKQAKDETNQLIGAYLLPPTASTFRVLRPVSSLNIPPDDWFLAKRSLPTARL